MRAPHILSITREAAPAASLWQTCGVDIRQATSDDAAELVRIINLAFQVEKFFIAGDRIDLAGIRDFMAKGEFRIAGNLGCVYLEPRGNRCYLGLLSVDPAAQGTGLGRRLMQAAESRARELGCQSVDLRIVNLRAGLPAFYAHMGYTANGSSEFPPDVPTLLPCHFVHMTKALA
jgi:GNAT superfamily N-acetyltransferase